MGKKRGWNLKKGQRDGDLGRAKGNAKKMAEAKNTKGYKFTKILNKYKEAYERK